MTEFLHKILGRKSFVVEAYNSDRSHEFEASGRTWRMAKRIASEWEAIGQRDVRVSFNPYRGTSYKVHVLKPGPPTVKLGA